MQIDPNWTLLVAVAVLTFGWALAAHRRHAWRAAATWRRLAILVLLSVVAMQFGFSDDDQSRQTDPAEFVLVIDRTTSMGAQDFRGQEPRMTGVAEDVAALVEQRPDARYAVIVVDNEAQLELPWTTDARAVRTLAETMGWREFGLGSGTDITVGLELALEVLQGSSMASTATERYLVYFGDGEQTGEQAVRNLLPLAELLTDALVLGYGTVAGGVMATSPYDDELVTLDGAVALSHLDTDALEQLAADVGGTLVHRTGVTEMDFWPNEAPVESEESQTIPITVSWLAAWVMTLLVAWELWASVSALRMARRELVA